MKNLDKYKKKVVYLSTLKFKGPLGLDRENTMNFFQNIRKRVKDLDYTGYDEKEKRYKLSKRSGADDRKLVLVGSSEIYTAVHKDTDYHTWDQFRSNIFGTISDHLKINILSIDFLDCVYRFEWDLSENHDDILYNALYKGSAIQIMVGKRRVYALEPYIMFALDEKQEIICRCATTTRTPMDEIREDTYKEKRELSTTCGIARTRGFSPDEKLTSYADEIAKLSLEFIENSFIPNFISRIENAIKERKSKK